MARRKAICYCCPPEKQEEKQPVEGHHVRPVEYDGPENGKKVDICASCHDLIHSAAEHFVTTGEMEEGLTDKQTLLVNYIVQSKLRFMGSGKKKADNARNMVSLSLSNQELAALHALKKRLGFSSLQRLLKYLIYEEFTKNK